MHPLHSFGERIRALRLEAGMPLRVVSEELEIDTAILSKIERGQRRASRDLVFRVAKLFNQQPEELLVIWLSDKIMYELADENEANVALQLAESRMEYLTATKKATNNIIDSIKETLKSFSGIKKAWLFGSSARNEAKINSDVDLAVEAIEGFSYFDLLEVQNALALATNKKVDIGFIDTIKPHILLNAKSDLKLIYEG
jgi:predicted nucleotidyltransferase